MELPTIERIALDAPIDARKPRPLDRHDTKTIVEPPSPTSVSRSAGGHEDALELEQMGYKQELLRGLNGFMSFSMSFTVCAIIPGVAQLYNFGLSTGGPAVMVWCWVVASLGCLATGLCLAEICSTYPQAGSVYYWAGQLSPPKWSPLASFLCGWMNLLGNLANSASFASGCITIIAAAVTLLNGSQVSLEAQVALSILLVALWGLQNIFRIDQQGCVNSIGAVVQVFGSICIVVVALSLAPGITSTQFVFASTYNGTGFENMMYVSLIGVVTPLYCYGGFEAAAHMAEETHRASRAAPKGIVYCCLVSFLSGFFMIVGLLYCTPSDAAAVQLGYPSGIDLLLGNPLDCDPSDPTCGGMYPGAASASSTGPGSSAQALVNLLWYCSGQTGGFILTILLALLVYISGMSSLTATSRIVFAMSRDNGLPLSKFIYHVNSRTKSPIRTVIFVVVLQALLLLLPLGNSTAFAQITTMSSIGYNLSYSMPILLRLTVARGAFRQSAFSLGRFSNILGWISVLWSLGTALILFFPQQFPVQAGNMNYSCVVVGGVLVLALLYWRLSAHRHFHGPNRDLASSQYRSGRDRAQVAPL